MTDSQVVARSGSSPAGPGRRRPAWVTPTLFIGPALVVMALVLGYPVVNAIWTSLNADYLTKPDADHFVGLGNFGTLLLHDPAFWSTVLRTVIWAVANLIPQILLGLVLAPILHRRLEAARARGARIVVIDPRRTATCDSADLHLPLRPGSDVLLFNGLLAHLVRSGAIDGEFLSRHTRGFADALAAAERDAPDYIEVDHNKMVATFARVPGLSDVPFAVQMEPNLVVEFYSR